MRNSFLPASNKGEKKNNTAPKYKMQTIVVSLIKLGALCCVIMAIRPAIKAASLRTNMPGPLGGLSTRESLLCAFLTSGLTDHDVAVFALPAVVEALHLDIVGRLGLEVTNHVPVFYT